MSAKASGESTWAKEKSTAWFIPRDIKAWFRASFSPTGLSLPTTSIMALVEAPTCTMRTVVLQLRRCGNLELKRSSYAQFICLTLNCVSVNYYFHVLISSHRYLLID